MRVWLLLLLGLACLQVHGEDDTDVVDTDDIDDDFEAGADAEESKDENVDEPVPELNESEDVLTLVDGNFEKFMMSNPRVVVDFYAPWCSHCKDLEREWLKAAHTLRQKGYKTRFGKMDATSNPKMGAENVVEGYPSVVYWGTDTLEQPADWDEQEDGKWEMPARKGKLIREPWLRYGYTHDAIVTAVSREEHVEPRKIKESQVQAVLDGLTPGQFSFVARVKADSSRAKAFFTLPKQLYQVDNITGAVFRFYYVQLPKTADAKKDSSLFLYRPGFTEPDPVRKDFTGAWTAGNIAKWAKPLMFATVNNFWLDDMWAPDNTNVLNMEKLVACVYDPKQSSQKEDFAKQLLELKAAQPSVAALLLNRDDLVQDKDARHFNPLDVPLPWISHLGAPGRYVLHGDAALKPNAVKEFLADIKNDKVKRMFRSAPRPKKEKDADGITTIVGESFFDIVDNPEKNVIVDYYKDDCEHCVELDPIWKKIAQKMKGSQHIVVAKFDAGANEHAEEIFKIPKVVLYPAVPANQKMKRKIEYTGPREYNAIVEFLSLNAKKPGDKDEEEDEL